MSSFLNTILQYTKPDYWDESDYENVRYKSITLSIDTEEYRRIQDEFITQHGSGYNITEISRIQHPYAYTSCQIRRKQLSVINGTSIPDEERIFLYVNNALVKDFLEYNCDKRKAPHSTCATSSSNCVVLGKEISGVSYNSRSSNRYPDYLVRYEKTNSDNLQDYFGRLRLS